MSQTWSSLYLRMNDPAALVGWLHDVLTGQGYQPYDPFPGGTGTPPGLTAMIRLFVSPATDGWVRVLGEIDAARLPDLSLAAGQPVLWGWLDEQENGYAVFGGGQQRDDLAAFEPFLRPGCSLDQLAQAFAGELAVPAVDGEGPEVVVVAEGDLPPELRKLAEEQGVSPQQAEKLFNRLSGSMLRKLARQSGDRSDDQAQARAMVMGAGRDTWNSLAGQRMRAIASVLDLPRNWRLPSYDAVRDAYQVYRLRQRSPRMPLMPGDREAMDSVPDALDYQSVYLGKK